MVYNAQAIAISPAISLVVWFLLPTPVRLKHGREFIARVLGLFDLLRIWGGEELQR